MSWWGNDLVQFARLLCELAATQDNLELQKLQEDDAMGVTRDEINELLDRANNVWEAAKQDANLDARPWHTVSFTADEFVQLNRLLESPLQSALENSDAAVTRSIAMKLHPELLEDEDDS